jgi:hypothetical protein
VFRLLPFVVRWYFPQGLYHLWDKKWVYSHTAGVLLGLSQAAIIGIGIASAAVFDKPGTVAAILCTYVSSATGSV